MGGVVGVDEAADFKRLAGEGRSTASNSASATAGFCSGRTSLFTAVAEVVSDAEFGLLLTLSTVETVHLNDDMVKNSKFEKVFCFETMSTLSTLLLLTNEE